MASSATSVPRGAMFVNTPVGNTPEALRQAIVDNLYYRVSKIPAIATSNDWYLAVAFTVRDRIISRWINTFNAVIRGDVRLVSYLSAEFLPGPHLVNNMINLGIHDQMRAAMQDLGLDADIVAAQEEEPGLGNGGLGRLAACFMDSLSTLKVVSIGYGIRYEFGLFDQEIRAGRQMEITDKWLHLGNPWEIERPEINYEIGFGGHTVMGEDREGRYRVWWVPEREVKGVAYDTPIAGYGDGVVNLLRLWKAEAVESFDFEAFNQGDYYGAVDEKVLSETISKVLYPNDEPPKGKILRLAQQYFFVSCTLQDLIRIHFQGGNTIETFHHWNAVQLNDTHPAIAVAELMRLLLDKHFLGWDKAWDITGRTFSYTNHTLLAEALETWPLPMFKRQLPRHMEIIYEINRRFLGAVRKAFPDDEARLARMSIIDEHGQKAVRMAHLAVVGSHAVNGVAALHSELVKQTVLKDFYELTPDKFHNVTNGVTPRRWMALCNPRLTRLISSHIGGEWIGRLETDLKAIEAFADDTGFQEAWRTVKRENKAALARLIAERSGVTVLPESLFDIQVKRIHEYKRQHLNLLHTVVLYNRLRSGADASLPPRTVIFGGKAAPGYFMAKLIIRLINAVAEVVNRDPAVGDRLKVVFFPDFNVKNAHYIYPAADLSEQISLAGKEASGTGNMKFSMNGALTIGTLDGANVEIRKAVGEENFFLFGMTAEEVARLKAAGDAPRNYYDAHPELKEAVNMIASGYFSGGDASIFRPFVDNLLYEDPYMVLADFSSYLECQQSVSAAYLDPVRWVRMSILNVARVGWFSSDRAIRAYCEKIWKVSPLQPEGA